jgi:hypothetical protein
VTPADSQKLVETLQERLVQLLGPLGIETTHVMGGDTKQIVATFTFRVRERRPDGTLGKTSEMDIKLDTANAMQSHRDRKHLEGVAVLWAGYLADWVPELFEDSTLPSATEIDWRPGEALPEDFRAS